MTIAPRKVSVAGAAELAQCHPETIRRAIRTKELLATRHPTKPGRPFEISVTDLHAFQERRRLG